MRENRTHGSEGGEDERPSLPLSPTPSFPRPVIPAKAGIHAQYPVIPANAGIHAQYPVIPANAGIHAPPSSRERIAL